MTELYDLRPGQGTFLFETELDVRIRETSYHDLAIEDREQSNSAEMASEPYVFLDRSFAV